MRRPGLARALAAGLVFSVLASAALASCAAPAREQRRREVKPFRYRGWVADFHTGLQLVVYSLPHMSEVSVTVSYRVGTIDDPPGKEGLTHLVEHLSFRARQPGRARTWDRLEATAGSRFNGYTRGDTLDFEATTPVERLPDLLAVEADRLADPLAGIDEAEFRREREVVLREQAQRVGDGVAAQQLEWLVARALPGSPYARAETPGSLSGITLADVRAFVREHLTPAHVVVVVSGPVLAHEVGGGVARAFKDLANGKAQRPVPATPPEFVFGTAIPGAPELREAPVPQPVLWVAWPVPGDVRVGGPRALAAARYLDLLGLPGALWRFGSGVASYSAFPVRNLGVSLVVARVELVRREDAEAVLGALRDEARLWSGLHNPKLVTGWLRRELFQDALLQLESLALPDVARYLRQMDDPDLIGGWQAAVEAQLGQELTPFVQSYLGPDRLSAVLVVPSGAAPAALRPHLPEVEGGGPRHASGGEPGASPGDPLEVLRNAPFPMERRRLSNGLEVVFAPRPGFGVVEVRLSAPSEPLGSLDRTRAELALAASRGDDEVYVNLGMSRAALPPLCSTGILYQDRLDFVARLPAELLEEALDRVSCRPRRNPTLDGPLFEAYRRALTKGLERTAPVAGEVIEEALLERLYPGAPFAARATAARVAELSTREGGRWLERTVRPDRALLVLSGDVRPDPDTLALVEERFGSWRTPGAAAPAPPPAAALPAARGCALVAQPGATQATITVGLRAPPRAARDEPAFRALLWSLEHDLRTRLRFEQAAAYDVSVDVLDLQIGASILVHTVVAGERAASATGVILRALESLGKGGDDAAALARARWQVALEYAPAFGTSSRNALRVEELRLHGLPSDEWSTLPARVASLDAGRLRAQRTALSVGLEAVVVFGDPSVAAALRAEGLDPVLLDRRPAH